MTVISVFLLTFLLICRHQYQHQHQPMASWVDTGPDPADEPVEDAPVEAILLSLRHGHSQPDRERERRQDLGEHATTEGGEGG